MGDSDSTLVLTCACSTWREQNVLAQSFQSFTSVSPCFQLLKKRGGSGAPLFLPSELLTTLSYGELRLHTWCLCVFYAARETVSCTVAITSLRRI